MKNEIYLRRKNKLIIKKKNSKSSKALLATLLKNIESLGFTFSKDIINILKTYSVTDLELFYKNIVKSLKKIVGAKVKYNPMYPNFPKQVMEASKVELYFNAIIHYITLSLPEYEKINRSKLKEKTKLRIIEAGEEKEFLAIFKDLLNAKVALSPVDKNDVIWFVKQYREKIVNLLPTEIENKENLSFFIGILKEMSLILDSILGMYFKTATDVLRLITALSKGDVSLSTNTKFKNFSRPDRKLFLRMLEKCSSLTEDMIKYKNKWIKIGEILHPFEYKDIFPACFKAFSIIRNNEKVTTFSSLLEQYIKNKKDKKVINLLMQRPGEFARRLDWVLRTFKSHTDIVKQFEKIANKIAPNVLMQVLAHFKNRNTKPYRAFFPKGNVSKVQLIDNQLEKIEQKTCIDVIHICERSLISIFAKRDSLGNTYIDKKLKDYTVPFALRSASKSLRTVSRGSKIEMDKGSTIRLFLYWKQGNGTGRVDIDLSTVMYDKDWNYLEHVSYTNLKSTKYEAYHSGDITEAPRGASEFVDIDIQSVLAYGGRYAVMSVFSYTEQPFITIPECYAGVMLRKRPNSGEIYEPRTVKDKFDLTSQTKTCIPLIFDLLKHKIIWCDLGIASRASYNCLETNQKSITSIGKAMTTLVKPDLYSLFVLHAKARGHLVSNKKDAKTIFSVSEGITPFDIEKIISNYI